VSRVSRGNSEKARKYAVLDFDNKKRGAIRQMPRIRETVLAALFVAVILPAAAGPAIAGEVEPLFASDDLLEITIRAPIREIMRVRPLDDDMPGTLTYSDPVLGETTLDIGLRTRGRYRRQDDVCPFAPLRLNFRKGDTRGTLFEGSNKMKLVTHCRNSAERYSQNVLKEYLAYRILNLLTEASFRVRLLRVTYIDDASDEEYETNFAFLIEHRDQLADRLGLEVNDAKYTETDRLDAAHTNIASVFQYLIGNTDFSPIRGAEGEPCCHNYVLFGDEPGHILSVPYDFDMAGLVDAPYATPNPRFRLRSVRVRLYRGRCANDALLDRTLDLFRANRQNIFDLVSGNPYFSDGSRKKVTRYLEDFFEDIDNPKRVERDFRKKCIN